MEVLDPQTMVDRIHKAPHRGVIHTAGGGSGVLPLLMKRGGGSATVLNASTPHGVKAVPSLLGYNLSTPNRWPKAVSSAVARGLAMVAYQQAVQLCEDEPIFGIGCTVSLAKTPSERINREHKGYVVLQTQDATIEISFSSHQSDRVTEEEMVERIILDLVANGCGLVHLTCRSEAERQSHKTIHASAATCNHMQLPSLILREMPFIIYRLNPGNMPEQVAIDSLSRDGLTFLSGSFNPPHQGHRAMRKISTSYTGEPCHLELSITNANKPPLDYLTIQERLVRIAEEGDEGYRGEPQYAHPLVSHRRLRLLCARRSGPDGCDVRRHLHHARRRVGRARAHAQDLRQPGRPGRWHPHEHAIPFDGEGERLCPGGGAVSPACGRPGPLWAA